MPLSARSTLCALVVDLSPVLINSHSLSPWLVERFRTITSAYYRGAHGVMLVFDLTSAQSFTSVRSWMRNITEYAGKDILKVLVGNKCDLAEKRAVPAGKCEALAKEYDIPYFEVSAKAGTNVEEAFVNIATRIKREVIDALPASEEPVSVDKPVGSSKDWNRAIRMRGGSATTDGSSSGKATTSCCGS